MSNEKTEGKVRNMEQLHLDVSAGDIVYVIYRNPHVQDAANVQEAAVVRHPEHPDQLALFLYETYYPLSDELAVYKNEEEAHKAFQYYFGDISSW